MAPPPDGEDTRLDSWKAIAEYLQRDLATVRRWEKAGLPVHRVPGVGRRSVFAYRGEIDTWLASSRLQAAEGPEAPTVLEIPLAPQAPPVPRSRRWRQWSAAAVVVAGTSVGAWFWSGSRVSGSDFRVKVTEQGVRAADAAGREVWRHAFPAAQKSVPIREDASVLAGHHPAVYAATMHAMDLQGDVGHSGQLLEFSLRGQLTRTFSFLDELRVGGKPFGPPWAMTDYAIDDRDGRRRIALAAHHYIWSPSVVTILDDAWQRIATFEHDGWIESVNWVGPDRLLVGRFSQAENAGVVALLDVTKPRMPPIRMVAMPRTEVNIAGAAPFNRAVVQLLPDRVLARTTEVPATAFATEALYELDLTLSVRRVSFSSRYWETHRALERERKIDHAQEQCPDVDGPRQVRVWTAASGWTTETIRK